MSHTYDLRKNPKKNNKLKEMEGENDKHDSFEHPDSNQENEEVETVGEGDSTMETQTVESVDKSKEASHAEIIDILCKLHEKMETQKEEIIRAVKQEFKQELVKSLEIHKEEMQEKIKEQVRISVKQLENQVETQVKNLEGFTETQLMIMKGEINRIDAEIESQKEVNEEKVQKLESKVYSIITNEMDLIVSESSSKLEHHMKIEHELIHKSISRNLNHSKENKEMIDKHEAQIKGQGEKIQAIHDQINERANTLYNIHQLPEIIINHVGINEHQLKLPSFSNKTRNPWSFLSQFNKYYEHYKKRKNPQDCLSYLELIEQCFEGNVANWFQIVKDDLKGKDEFETKFLNQYWSREIQKGVKKRIEAEHYREDGKMTRMEYVIDRTLTLKAMIPPMEEEEIVRLLADNFSERVQDSIRVQNITTLDKMIELLNREDMDSRTNHVKKVNPEYKTNKEPSHQYKETYNNRGKHDRQPDPYGQYNRFLPTGTRNNNPNDTRQVASSTWNRQNQGREYRPYHNNVNLQSQPYTHVQQSNFPHRQNNHNHHNYPQANSRAHNFQTKNVNYIGTYRRRSFDTYPTGEQQFWTRKLLLDPQNNRHRSTSPHYRREDGRQGQSNSVNKPGTQNLAEQSSERVTNDMPSLN